MTNQEIKKHKEELVTVITGLKMAKNEPLEQRVKKLGEGIKELQNLAEDVGALKYLGNQLQVIDQLLSFLKEGNQFPSQQIPLAMERCAACEIIYMEIHDNILYKLQIEMMFNACISAEKSCKLAKWSCFWAAVAAIVACISVILTMYLN